jgi:hypothetical protein
MDTKMQTEPKSDTFLLNEVPELRAARDAMRRYLEAMPSIRANRLSVSVLNIDYSGPHAKVTWVEFKEDKRG